VKHGVAVRVGVVTALGYRYCDACAGDGPSGRRRIIAAVTCHEWAEPCDGCGADLGRTEPQRRANQCACERPNVSQTNP
jgi:hypothetical protein